MSREIAQAGFNLTDNGIVAADSVTDANGNSTIRIRANLNKFVTSASTAARAGIGTQGEDAGEDVKYFIYPTQDTTLLARYDAYGTGSTVLANRLDSLHVHYFAQKVSYSAGTVAVPCDISAPSQAEVGSPSAAKYRGRVSGFPLSPDTREHRHPLGHHCRRRVPALRTGRGSHEADEGILVNVAYHISNGNTN